MTERRRNPQTGEEIFLNPRTNRWEPWQSPSAQPVAAIDPVTMTDWARAGAQGASFNYSDEVLAGVRTLAQDTNDALLNRAMQAARGEPVTRLSTSYGPALESERARLANLRSQHPYGSLAAELGGGLLTGIGGGSALANSAFGQAVRKLPLLSRMGVSGLIGGGVGAIAGAGAANTLEEAPGKALRGGIGGAVLGPLVEAGASGGQALTRRMSPERSAERIMRRAISRGDETIDQIRARLRKLGPGAVLADVNEGLLNELDRIVATPGAARSAALKQLRARSLRQTDEVLGATGRGDYWRMLDEVKETRRNAGNQLYRAAFKKDLPESKELDEILGVLNDEYPKFWDEAKRVGRLEFRSEGLPVPPLGDAKPSLAGWNAIKKWMGQKVDGLFKASQGDEAISLDRLEKRLLRELDALVPEYREARQFWGSSREYQKMLDAGRGFTNTSLSQSELGNKLSKMTEIDRLAYREGARQALQDTVERGVVTGDNARIFNTTAMRKKMQHLFGRREGATILRQVIASGRKQATFNRVQGNSLTALRQASQRDDALPQEVASAALDAATTTPAQWLPQIGRRATQMLGPREATRNEVARMLLESDPMRQSQILGWLQGAGQPLRPTTGAGLLPPIALGVGSGLLSVQP